MIGSRSMPEINQPRNVQPGPLMLNPLFENSKLRKAKKYNFRRTHQRSSIPSLKPVLRKNRNAHSKGFGSVQRKTTRDLYKKDEFKINFDVYNFKRLHQPQLYTGARKLQKLNDMKKTQPFHFNDENLLVTSTKIVKASKRPILQRKIEEVQMVEKEEEEDESDFVTSHLDSVKKLVNKESKFGNQKGNQSARGEFPMRFAAKPFVHYGYGAKVAALKKREAEDKIKDNDNKMKMYIAMLQKEKRSKKPTIQTIENQRKSPIKYVLEDTQKSIDISEDFKNINIETRPKNLDLEFSSTNHYSSQPILTNLPSPEKEELPKISTAESPSPQKLNLNESLLFQSGMLQEMSILNKSVIDKNNEHVPKQKIISSIRKFDDRCINYHKAHRSLVDLTMGYMFRSKACNNPDKDTATREKLMEQNMRDINSIKKDQMLNYSVDPYSGDT